MFFHVGFAARNAVTAVELAELGAFISVTALDGRAGLFAALRRLDRAAEVAPFEGARPEILNVFHKPAPACNYAQTPCQAALAIAREHRIDSGEIAAVHVKCTAAALNYPGCNAPGPFDRILQAKMSIHFCVAATLARSAIEERNYRMLDDPEIARLTSLTTLEEDPALSAAYPARQGAEVNVTLRNGRVLRHRMADLVPAAPELIRERFRSAAEAAIGRAATGEIETRVDNLEQEDDIAALSAALGKRARN
jgi:2-methylcitrate dehydratase PrpD